MKEFVVYTALRLLLLVASFGIVAGIWAMLDGGQFHLFWTVILAFLISGVASWFLLSRPREAFAARMEDRAARTSAAFEARKAREDTD